MQQQLNLDAYNVGAKSQPKWTARGLFFFTAFAMMLVDLYLIFMYAPEDAAQGPVQRILYFHVPIALTTFAAFGLVFLGSIMYLITRRPAWDRFAHGNAEIGVLFTSLMLITGSIWGKSTWGVWWQWEPRLTMSLLLWLIYVAYLMVRAFAPTPARAARYSSIIGIVGFIDVPIVYFAVTWWRTVHPGYVVGPAAGDDVLDPKMGIVLLFSMLTFAALYAHMLKQRLALARLQNDVTGITNALEDARQPQVKAMK